MNLQELRDLGGFVEAEPVKVPVTWARKNAAGVELTSTFDVWIRRRAFGLVDRIMAGESDRSRSAEMIAQCVLLGEAKEAISYADAYQLHPALAWALVAAINEASAPKN